MPRQLDLSEATVSVAVIEHCTATWVTTQISRSSRSVDETRRRRSRRRLALRLNRAAVHGLWTASNVARLAEARRSFVNDVGVAPA